MLKNYKYNLAFFTILESTPICEAIWLLFMPSRANFLTTRDNFLIFKKLLSFDNKSQNLFLKGFELVATVSTIFTQNKLV